ncbi:MAG: hypothetical protein MZW92_36860 [Comamonadaceae bacterium]|nr:hypothetical protein [Comamonadaceae bacterium]
MKTDPDPRAPSRATRSPLPPASRRRRPRTSRGAAALRQQAQRELQRRTGATAAPELPPPARPPPRTRRPMMHKTLRRAPACGRTTPRLRPCAASPPARCARRADASWLGRASLPAGRGRGTPPQRAACWSSTPRPARPKARCTSTAGASACCRA